ncbi:MAG: vWA domain-containing protein [Anaerolineae bacterium]
MPSPRDQLVRTLRDRVGTAARQRFASRAGETIPQGIILFAMMAVGATAALAPTPTMGTPEAIQEMPSSAAAATPRSYAVAATPDSAARGNHDALRLPTPTVESPCWPVYNKTVSPRTVLLGETIDITLTVRALCAGEPPPPEHIAFVMDSSASMVGTAAQDMRDATAQLVSTLGLDDHPWTYVSVIEFNSSGRRLCPLSNDELRVIGAIKRVEPRSSGTPVSRPPRHDEPDGNTRLDLGIRDGLRILRVGRHGVDVEPDELTEVMVVVSDGRNDEGCRPVLNEVRKAQGQGVLVIAACAGADCDEQCMRQVASSPRYFFTTENLSSLWTLFERIRDQIRKINIRQLEVEETLPPHMALVSGSVDPRQAEPDDVDRRLLWRDVYVPQEGVTYTLKARPLRAGYLPANELAVGRLIDNKGRGKTWTFDVPWVTVLAPTPAAVPLVTAHPYPPTVTPRP